jgi:hypothetical protein
MAIASIIASSAIKTPQQIERKNKMKKRCMIALAAMLSAWAVPALAADTAPAVIDNERVRVFDTTSATLAMPDDFVAISFADGNAIFGHAGETASHGGARTVVIDLKNHPVAPLPNNSGYPNAYPRWNLGEPTPMHFHDKDVVVVYLEDSALQSTEPDGRSVVNEYKSGDIRFNKRDRVHTELLVHDAASAVITELK